MNGSADEIRKQIVGFACRRPQELFTAGATDVVVVPGTTLAVPVVRSTAPIAERFIGFTADDRCDVRLREVEAADVAAALAQRGVGVRAAVTWVGDGFHGHLEVWEPAGGVLDAVDRLRRFLDGCWPQAEGDVPVDGPPPGSESNVAMLAWGRDGQGFGQLGVACDGAATMADRVTAGLNDSRAAVLELFAGLDPVVGPDGSLRDEVDLSTVWAEVDIADAADWRVRRAESRRRE